MVTYFFFIFLLYFYFSIWNNQEFWSYDRPGPGEVPVCISQDGMFDCYFTVNSGHIGYNSGPSLGCKLDTRHRGYKYISILLRQILQWRPTAGEFPAQKASNAENFFHLMKSSWQLIFAWQSII